MSSVRAKPSPRDNPQAASAPHTSRGSIVLPLVALLVLFLAALGYPAVRVILADELPAVEMTEIAAAEPSDDALVLDPDVVRAEAPALAEVLDLAVESGEMTLLDHETSQQIREWFTTTHGIEPAGLTVRWYDSYFSITTGSL